MESRKTLDRVHFKVTTLPGSVYVIQGPEENMYTGLCMDILKEFAKYIGFSFEISQPGDKQYGALQANGTWTGNK